MAKPQLSNNRPLPTIGSSRSKNLASTFMTARSNQSGGKILKIIRQQGCAATNWSGPYPAKRRCCCWRETATRSRRKTHSRIAFARRPIHDHSASDGNIQESRQRGDCLPQRVCRGNEVQRIRRSGLGQPPHRRRFRGTWRSLISGNVVERCGCRPGIAARLQCRFPAGLRKLSAKFR